MFGSARSTVFLVVKVGIETFAVVVIVVIIFGIDIGI